MIKIEFTCKTCGATSEITADDIDERTIVPVCASCYQTFLSRKAKLIKSFEKRMNVIYEEYGIPFDTFNVAEELSDL